MARGWGKSAEEVEQEAEERRRQRGAPAVDVSPKARARRERLESLRLSRARTLEQLERSTNGAHREMLRRTLRSLETEIDELGRDGDGGDS